MSLFRAPYNFRDNGVPPQNDRLRHLTRLTKPNTVIVREPEMTGTTCVALPAPDFACEDYKAKSAVLDDRLSGVPGDFNPWLFYGPGVRKFGRIPTSLFFDNPDDGFVPADDHPVHLIYDAVYRTVKSGQPVSTPFGTSDTDDWKALLDGDEAKKQYASLTRPSMLYAFYCVIYSSGQEVYAQGGQAPLGAAGNEQPVLMVIGLNAVQSLLGKIDARLPGHEGSEDMASLKFPVITGTTFIHFFDRKKGTCPAMQAAQASVQQTEGFGNRRRVQSGPAGAAGGAAVLAGYDVYLSLTESGSPTGPTNNRKIFAKVACDKVKPWDQVIRGHTPDECAAVVAEQCGLPLSLLHYAWASKPQFYSERMKDALRNPRSVVGFGSGPANTPTPPAASGYSVPAPGPSGVTPPFAGDPWGASAAPGHDATAASTAPTTPAAAHTPHTPVPDAVWGVGPPEAPGVVDSARLQEAEEMLRRKFPRATPAGAPR